MGRQTRHTYLFQRDAPSCTSAEWIPWLCLFSPDPLLISLSPTICFQLSGSLPNTHFSQLKRKYRQNWRPHFTAHYNYIPLPWLEDTHNTALRNLPLSCACIWSITAFAMANNSNTRWQFIDTSSDSRNNLTQVKRHVMQEYMRQKKGTSQQSESDEEAPRPQPKRGRPRKNQALAGIRKSTSTRKPATDGTQRILNLSPRGQEPPQMDSAPCGFDTVQSHLPSSAALERPVPDAQAPRASFALPFCDPLPQPDGFILPPDMTTTPSPVQSSYMGFDGFLSGTPTHSTPWDLAQSPRTMMSAARTDPFNSLPLELDQGGQRLFDFYVNDMPACSYGSHYRSQSAHNWYTSVFVPEAMKGDVAFQNTILVHAANTWAWVRNEAETPDTLLHRDRAVSMLREHLQNNPGVNSDVAIISCLSAAALEDFDPRPGHKEISWVHMRAARDMIRARGGPAAFANTRLGMLINWQDYILSGYETHGPSFHFENTPPATTPPAEPIPQPAQPAHAITSIPSPPSSVPSPSDTSPSCIEVPTATIPPSMTYPIDEIRLQCEEFLHFLRRCEQLALYQRQNPDSCDVSRHTAVQETSLLFRILVSPPGSRFTSSGDRKQMVARLSALIMLNAALWDYRYTPAHAANFIRTLEQSIVDSEVNMSGSVEAVLQLLLKCDDGYSNNWPTEIHGNTTSPFPELNPDFSQYSPTASSPSARPWFTGRMLKIAKRLGADSWYRVSGFLFSCMTLRMSESTVYLWETDLRREILDAPLTSYVMPSLM